MHTISNVVDIYRAKVHKRASHYGASNLAGGKPRLSSINGWLLRYLTIYEFTVAKLFSIILLPCLESVGACVFVCLCVFPIMITVFANIFLFCFAREQGHNIKPDLSDLLFPTHQVQILHEQLWGQRREPAMTCYQLMGKVIQDWLESPQVMSNSHLRQWGTAVLQYS